MRDLITEALVEQYIPNDCVMEGTTDRVHIITGPNSSGKSSYVRAVCPIQTHSAPHTHVATHTCVSTAPLFKQRVFLSPKVACVVHLAHVGSFVPAQSALVGLSDRIVARTAAPSTACGAGRSTFAADLAQVAVMLRHATGTTCRCTSVRCARCLQHDCSSSTGRSLCVLDEFGKGTLATDGAGLLAGCLQHWAAAGAACPKMLACTHFLELAARDDVLPRYISFQRG